MIYGISGRLVAKRENFIVVDTNGTRYKIYASPKTISALPVIDDEVHFFTHLEVKENALDLYGFPKEKELMFFEKLISVSGIGPKTALSVMAIAPVEQIAAAINENKTELLTRVSGIGTKIAERVVLELKGKLPALYNVSEENIKNMEADIELEETLVALGYSKFDAKKAISKIEFKNGRIEDRLKEALKNLK